MCEQRAPAPPPPEPTPTGMRFCPYCAGALQTRVPPGDERARLVCAECARVHYENPKVVAAAVAVTPDGATSSGVRSGTVVVSNAPGSWGDDDYVLDAAAIAGDALTLNVLYGGECATHRFTLVASETFMESFPVQLAVLLAHDANGDARARRG